MVFRVPLPKLITIKAVLPTAILIFSIVSVATGEVTTKVCLSDGNTPFPPADINLPYIIYPDIMVGTKLTIIVDSNLSGYWFGGALGVEDIDMYFDVGHLEGRDCDSNGCAGSILPAAGPYSEVFPTVVPTIGFLFYPRDEPNAGDWFIFDYNSTGMGDCNIGFYDLDINETKPVHTLMFHHVRTRDFNGDTTVDFIDFASLALYWQVAECDEPDWCQGTDLDTDGGVDMNDLMLFCEYWLERTE